MNCHNCGCENTEGVNFCCQCGNELNKTITKKKPKQQIKILFVLFLVLLVCVVGFIVYNGGINETVIKITDRYYLSYAENHLENNELDEAFDTYKKIVSKEKAEGFYFDLCYAYGNLYYDEGRYEDSLKWLNYIENSYEYYDDVEDLINDSKYGYILENKNNNDDQTFEYLKELKEEGFKDCDYMYDELYSWNVDFCVNNSESDTSTDMYNISNDYKVYFHISLEGGTPHQSTYLSYKVYYPDGTISNKSWSGKFYDGDTGWVSVSTSQTGTLTVDVYDDNNDFIGKKSVNLTY